MSRAILTDKVPVTGLVRREALFAERIDDRFIDRFSDWFVVAQSYL